MVKLFKVKLLEDYDTVVKLFTLLISCAHKIC